MAVLFVPRDGRQSRQSPQNTWIHGFFGQIHMTIHKHNTTVLSPGAENPCDENEIIPYTHTHTSNIYEP